MKNEKLKEEAAIVGYGCVLPQGEGRAALDRVLAGEGAAREWEEDRRLLVGRVAAELVQERPGEDRAVALGLRAAELAMADAGELGVEPERFACLFTVSKGGLGVVGEYFSGLETATAKSEYPISNIQSRRTDSVTGERERSQAASRARGKEGATTSSRTVFSSWPVYAGPCHPPSVVNEEVTADFFAGIDAAAAGRAVARRYGLRGGTMAPVSACSSGGHVLAAARAMIVSGRAEAVICGAADASILPIVLASYDRLGLLVHVSDVENKTATTTATEEETASPSGAGGLRRRRNCNARRKTALTAAAANGASALHNGNSGGGFFVGEGAAAFVVTSVERAEKKGLRILARVAGSAAGSQATSLIDMPTDGVDLARVMELALGRAGVGPEAVDVVMVHGTATRAGDRNEGVALERVFGGRVPAVVGTKGLHGHLLGAACAVETAVMMRGMERRVWRVGLKISAGFGGHISANVLVR